MKSRLRKGLWGVWMSWDGFMTPSRPRPIQPDKWNEMFKGKSYSNKWKYYWLVLSWNSTSFFSTKGHFFKHTIIASHFSRKASIKQALLTTHCNPSRWLFNSCKTIVDSISRTKNRIWKSSLIKIHNIIGIFEDNSRLGDRMLTE
jgi:hypothetical protein